MRRKSLEVLYCITFSLFVWGLYEQSSQSIVRAEKILEEKKKFLLHELQKEEEKSILLQTQLDSSNDPEWIEYLLIKKLGMVPEGAKKVYFQKSEEK